MSKNAMKQGSLLLSLFAGLLMATATAQAGTFDNGMPEGWACEGNCGTSEANGVVTLAPEGGARYGWVSTARGRYGLGLPGAGGTNGTRLRSPTFSAEAGTELTFDFNYITSDGAGYADYAWARILDSSLNQVALLFTARTTNGGSTVPGFGMPPVESVITPSTVSVIRGAPRWSPLGGSSGSCWSYGCGYTGWVQSSYVFPASGDYLLEVGVVNWWDSSYQSGMAFDGILLGGNPIGEEPDYQDVHVVARLPRSGIQLHPDAFTTPPARIEETGDYFEIEWVFDEFEIGKLERLDYPVTLVSPQPGEIRTVVEQVTITYSDLTGQAHRQVLGPQTVEVLPSIFAIATSTDRSEYSANEGAVIDTLVTNLSDYTAQTDVHVVVRDSNGGLVQDLGTIHDVALLANESKNLPTQVFSTGTTYAGEYEVYAELLDGEGQRLVHAVAPFTITTASPGADAGVSATIATDRHVYSPFQTVNVQDRITNVTSNAAVEGLTAVTTVYRPDGSSFWSKSQPLRQLLPGGSQEISYQLPLQDTAAGEYRVQLVVTDAQDEVRAESETSITVLSTADTGVGIAGTVSATPNPVLRTEPLTISANVVNKGNAGLTALPVTLMLVDPASQREIGRWTETIDLPSGATYPFSVQWIDDLPAGTELSAILSAELNGESRTLDYASVRVEEKLVSSTELNGYGRLLVLLDAPLGECRAVTRLRFAFAEPQFLGEGESLEVALYDDQGNLLDGETGSGGESGTVDRSGGAGANLALSISSAEGVVLEIDAEALEGSYRLSAALHQAAEVRSFDSGLFDAGCTGPAPGEVLGSFELIAADMLAEGPQSSRRAYLEALLREAGWSYTIVTAADAFAYEMRRGGYSGYALLSADIHLAVQVQRELREAIFAGAGIVMGGAHDDRNHHLLEVFGDVFGASLVGSVDAAGIRTLPGTALEAPELAFPVSEKSLAMRLAGGVALAEYVLNQGRPQDQTAIAFHAYGAGRSLIAGFDLLGQAEASGPDSGLGAFLLDGLAHVHPSPVVARSTTAIPVAWSIINRGEAGVVRLRIDVGGMRIVDPGPAPAELLGPTTLEKVIDMPARTTDEVRFWWQLPEYPEDAWVTERLALGEGVTFRKYGLGSVTFPMELLPDFSDVRAAINAMLETDRRYNNILGDLDRAEEADARGDAEKGVFNLLKAADGLAAIGNEDADAVRTKVAWLIRRLSMRI